MRTDLCTAARTGAIAAASLLAAACSESISGVDTASIKPAADAVNASFVPGVPKGYQCPLVPNGFDPAGSIYRLDKDGTYFRVKGIEANWQAVKETPDAALLTTLCMICPFDPREKQALLEAPTLDERAAMLLALIEMGAHGGPGSEPGQPLS